MTNQAINPMEVIEKYASHAPVPVFDIIRDLGLGLVLIPLEDNISGWIERKTDGNYEIAVNSNHPFVRQRFTAAHELGHFIYHRDLLGSGVGDTRAYRAEGTRLPNTEIRPAHERQANSFAANLLMPRDTVNALRSQGVVEPDKLAQRLGVSRQAMCIRLGINC